MTDKGWMYFVARNPFGVRRVELGIRQVSAGPRFSLPLDDALGIRTACLEVFAAGNRAILARLRPTPYQAARLALLLDILDRLDARAGEPADTRAIAAELVFPGAHIPERAIEWKSTGFRRQTQRLVAAARAMCADGFADLLKGRTSQTNIRISGRSFQT